MRVARHWVRAKVSATDRRGEEYRGEAWGWSETSEAEAQQRATARAQRVAEWLAQGMKGAEPARGWQYSYGLDRPPREEIVQELADSHGAITALITRNAYGALVLNTRSLMFVDVDFPQPAGSTSLIGRLFGKPAPAIDHEAESLSRVRAWCDRNADHAVRVYRTAAGLRIAILDRPIEPNGPDARRILDELGSDPLYKKLCEVQSCFRARLTPKPWRVEAAQALGPHPADFPYEDLAAEARCRAWQKAYGNAAMNYATCRLVESRGDGTVRPELHSLVSLHDSLTGVESTLALA